MRIGKTIKWRKAGYDFHLGEVVRGEKGLDPIVEVGNLTINPLHHIILVPEIEGAFNRAFNRRTNLTVESIANFNWWYSIHQEGLRSLIADEFARPDVSFHWNMSVIPWGDGQAISIVFGHPKAMEMVYERGLRTHQPQT